MHRMMQSQFSCCTETLWTFTANIRLHSFMSLNLYFDMLIVCCWISSDKCHTWTKYFHRVTSADVSWVGQVFENSLNTVYSFPQWGHSYGLLLLCTRCLCCCKLLDWLKLLSHSEHLCGFSPVWILVWVFKCPDSTDCVCVFADSELLSIIWLILSWYLNWNVVIRWT